MSNSPKEGVLRRIIRSEIFETVPDFVWAVGDRGIELLKNPRNAVITIIFGYFVDRIIFPIFEAVAQVGIILVDSVQILFFGFDRTLGAGGKIGLADLPLVFVDLLTDGIQPAVTGVVGQINQINRQVARVAADAGLAALPVVTLAAVVEIGLALYVLWWIVETVDVPYVDVDGLLRTTAYPFRVVLGVFR